MLFIILTEYANALKSVNYDFFLSFYNPQLILLLFWSHYFHHGYLCNIFSQEEIMAIWAHVLHKKGEVIFSTVSSLY